MRNGLKVPTPPVVSVIIDDLDSRSSASASDSKSKSSRKNGCKKPSIDVDEYSNFIKNKIPTGGRKVKTTKELLEEMQARKTGKVLGVQSADRKRAPKEDFLTTYDSKKQMKKDTIILSDIIELNDSNSSSKIEEPIMDVKEDKKDIKLETGIKSESEDKPIKFEPVDVILARLPPIDFNWRDEDYIPDCTCTIVYDSPDIDDFKVQSPTIESKKSIFEMEDVSKEKEKSLVVPAMQNFEEKVDPNCPVAHVYNDQSKEVEDHQVDALHNFYLADVNGSLCESDRKQTTQLACRTSSWGLRPYYDCSRDLFHNVVPKYNFLDYSLDKCVKNLNNIVLDRYEPVEAATDTSEWYLNLENEHFEKWKAKNESLKCDDYQSAADSPFSEKSDVQNMDETNEGVHFDSDKHISDSDKSNLNLDRNENNSLHTVKISPETPDETEVEKSESDKKSELFNFFNFTGYGLLPQSQLVKKTYPNEKLLDEKIYQDVAKSVVHHQPEAVVVESTFVKVENPEIGTDDETVTYVPKMFKKFTYEDSITLLPLSLSALNSSSPYGCSTDVDLSCVFRTKCASDDMHHMDDDISSKEACDLSYSLVQNANILDMRDVASTLTKRTRGVFLSDHDEDANCDSDVKKLGVADGLTNSGAFVSDDSAVVETCVKNGCPSWIPGSVPSNSFREWHEPVPRKSHNGDTLTILPYVVID